MTYTIVVAEFINQKPIKIVLVFELCVLVIAAVGLLVLPKLIVKPTARSSAAVKHDFVVVAAGDIACDRAEVDFSNRLASGQCQDGQTAELIESQNPVAVLALGDLQYYYGSLTAFQNSYQQSWGKFKDSTFPVPGNHEYQTTDASGYYQYFADFSKKEILAGEPAKGYYSFNIGDWHLVGLNSNCADVGGCDAGSAQYQWLEQDLKANTTQCSLAYWHHPRFTSGPHNSTQETALSKSFWELLYKYRAELILNGHDHLYERFAPQDSTGQLDQTGGLRQFTVGTGGKSLYRLQPSRAANSEQANDQNYGVLKLSLSADKYSWDFLPAVEGGWADSGEAGCH